MTTLADRQIDSTSIVYSVSDQKKMYIHTHITESWFQLGFFHIDRSWINRQTQSVASVFFSVRQSIYYNDGVGYENDDDNNDKISDTYEEDDNIGDDAKQGSGI